MQVRPFQVGLNQAGPLQLRPIQVGPLATLWLARRGRARLGTETAAQ